MPHRFPTHNYSVSTLAYQALADKLVIRPHSRATSNRQRQQPVYNGVTIDYVREVQTTHIQGVGWALTLLARSHDLTEWQPTPQQHPEKPGHLLFYKPYDTEFMKPYTSLSLADLQEAIADMADWVLEEYKLQRSLERRQHRLSLDNSTRRYYAALFQFYQLPVWPHATHPDSLTTRVSVVLEAIGTDHLQLPDDYRMSIVDQPNKRLAHYTTHRGSSKLYGNFSHTPWVPRQWRKLPAMSEPWTQADVDWAASNNLADLAREAVLTNPSLHLPANTPAVLPSNTAASTTASQRKYHNALVPTDARVEPIYLYKGRDVTQAVMETYELHYERGVPLKRASTLHEYNIPYLAMYNMIRREYVKRQLTPEAPNESGEQPPS